MRSRTVAATAFGLLLAAFVADVLTPQTLVVAILFDVPIVLAALTRSRRLTAALVACALAADAAAAFANAAQDGYRWDPIGIGDRLLSMLSIAIVGYLSTAVQERAERVGRLAAQEARARREATLAGVAERIRASLSPELVVRALVREAPRALEAERAFWYPAGAGELLAGRAGAEAVEVLDERPSPEIASLTHRVAADGRVAVVRPIDPLGRFVLDRLQARSALAIPLSDRGTAFGVLVAASEAAADDALVSVAGGFAAIAVDALWQARLFAELAERNEALSDRQAVIRDLVYALSHDLRTPLAALSMTLRQAAEGAYGELPERYAAVLRDSRVAIDDLQALAETLLLVARFEAGEHRAEREPVDLRALAGEIASELRAMAQARGIALRVDAADGAATVRGSRGDLRRAISNLVANALQHTPRGGTVELRVAPRGTSVETVVADDGFGLDPGVREGLFGRFSATARSGGTGLGLYIVRRIVEESGGTVRYEPRSPRGSVFALAIPKATP